MACVLSRRERFLGPRRAVLAVNGYSYVHVLDTTKLVVWRQRFVPDGPSAPIRLQVFPLADLVALDPAAVAQAKSLRHTDATDWIGSGAVGACEIDTTAVGAHHVESLPEELGHLDEMLLLCQSSAIHQAGRLALVVVQPRTKSCEIYPQDWFNGADVDHDYQWVTRVARDRKTGLVHGEGIRMEPFVLDKTLRKLLAPGA